ncbi:hypothetical protein PCE1_000461 [Barthelona sp. PCE]
MSRVPKKARTTISRQGRITDTFHGKELSKEILEQYEQLTSGQKKVFDAVMDGDSNVFFTGAAGTGKSFLLKLIIKALRQRYNEREIYVTAPTGVAACNIGGTTLHSFGGLRPGSYDASDMMGKLRKSSNRKTKERWLNCRYLIIDEISMVSPKLFHLLNIVAKNIRGNPNKFFGGINLVVCGDFFQLPPVYKNHEVPKGSQPFFVFESYDWEEANFMDMNLNEIIRQKNKAFTSLLNKVRVAKIDELVNDTMNRLRTQHVHDPTILYTHNADVDRINQQELAGLGDECVDFKAKDKGNKSMLNHLIVPEILRLKVGAKVMLLKNIDFDANLVNGSTGTVTRIETKRGKPVPVVSFNGVEHTVQPTEFTIMQGQNIVAEREQIPLRLAWAITVHKCQGLTIDKVKLDIGRAFATGQAYVALSRCRDLNNLQVVNWNPRRIKADERVKSFYRDLDERLGQLSTIDTPIKQLGNKQHKITSFMHDAKTLKENDDALRDFLSGSAKEEEGNTDDLFDVMESLSKASAPQREMQDKSEPKKKLGAFKAMAPMMPMMPRAVSSRVVQPKRTEKPRASVIFSDDDDDEFPIIIKKTSSPPSQNPFAALDQPSEPKKYSPFAAASSSTGKHKRKFKQTVTESVSIFKPKQKTVSSFGAPTYNSTSSSKTYVCPEHQQSAQFVEMVSSGALRIARYRGTHCNCTFYLPS